MIRSGCGCHHSSYTQSLNARVVASPSSGSEHCEYTRPQKPVIIDGKLSDAHTPLMSMSCTRASTSKQPGPHLVEAERLDLHRLRPAPDHGVHADLRVLLAVELPHLVAPVG